MADVRRSGTNVGWNNVANWDGGAVPVDTDAIYIDSGSTDLTTNLDQTGGDVDPASLSILYPFSGSIGDESTNSLKFDDFSGFIDIDVYGNPNQILNLWPDTVPTVRIFNTGSHPYACYLRAGTISGNLEIYGGASIRLGASLVISGNLIIAPEPGRPTPQVTIMEGCSITGEIRAQGGVVRNYAAIAASVFRLTGSAMWWHLGEGAGNITNTLECHGRARAHLLGAGWTVGRADTYEDGEIITLPHGGNRSGKYTFTNATAHGGAIITKRQDAFTNTPVERGGRIPNYGTKTVSSMAGSGSGA